jgi:hypothetical protein
MNTRLLLIAAISSPPTIHPYTARPSFHLQCLAEVQPAYGSRRDDRFVLLQSKQPSFKIQRPSSSPPKICWLSGIWSKKPVDRGRERQADRSTQEPPEFRSAPFDSVLSWVAMDFASVVKSMARPGHICFRVRLAAFSLGASFRPIDHKRGSFALFFTACLKLQLLKAMTCSQGLSGI